jgi:hypothetical protein
MEQRSYFRVQANVRVTFGRPEQLGYIFEMRELTQALRHDAEFAPSADPLVLRLVDALTLIEREVEFLHRHIVGSDDNLFHVEEAELSEGGIRLNLPEEQNHDETWITLSFELHGRPQIATMYAVRQWERPLEPGWVEVGYGFTKLEDEHRAKIVALVFQEECKGRRSSRQTARAVGEE